MSEAFTPVIYEVEPLGRFAEGIRVLRSSLVHKIRAGLKSLVISSCWQGEGKTLVCINLAAAFAQLGYRVLLVDGDLRKGDLSRLLLCEASRSKWLPGVDLLPSQSIEGRLVLDVLTSKDYMHSVQSRFQDYDLVILDSPPLALFRDAFNLAALVDGLVMLASRRSFQGVPEGHVSEDLRESGVALLGVVTLEF